MGLWDKYGYLKKNKMSSGRKAGTLDPENIKKFNARVPGDVLFDFAIACRLVGAVQQTIITQWMEEFVEKIHQEVGDEVWQKVRKNEQLKKRLKK